VTGNGHGPVWGRDGEELSRVPVRVRITADYTGRIDVSVTGPVKGKGGLLALLDAATRIAEQMPDDQPTKEDQ
jgi:hypothetical protein